MQQLIVLLSAIAASGVIAESGCAPHGRINDTHHYQVVFKYCDQIDKTIGMYPNGTRLRAKCPKRRLAVIGNDKTYCVNGKWQPELGRCPWMCYLFDLNKFGYTWSAPLNYEDPNYYANNWKYNGTEVRAYCAKSLPSKWSGGHHWRCNDGTWQPIDPNYQKCTAW